MRTARSELVTAMAAEIRRHAAVIAIKRRALGLTPGFDG
jgi:hypothetical protein